MKVEKLNDNKLYVYCPACKCGHAFDERWTFNGDYEKPTFSPSMLVTMPYYGDIDNYVCHSFVTDGKIQFLNDCTHDLVGKTVDLLDVDSE